VSVVIDCLVIVLRFVWWKVGCMMRWWWCYFLLFVVSRLVFVMVESVLYCIVVLL